MGKLVSVVVPVYNAEKYIYKAVDSILEQTYKNIEIILVDDGSPDNCPVICDEYAVKDKRVKVIHQKNMGVVVARNKGVLLSKGDYIGFVDPDDWIDKKMMETMINIAEKSYSDIVICDYKTFSDCSEEQGETHKQKLNNDWPIEKFRDEFLFDHYPNFLCNKLFNRNLFENLFCPVNITLEDLYMCAELFARSSKVIYVSQPFYCYRIHDSFANTIQKIRRKYGLFMAWREHERVCEAYGYQNPLEYSRLRAQKAAISLLVINEAADYLSSEQKEDAEAYLQKDDKALNGLPLKHQLQWWTYKNMRPVCKIFGKISIFFDKLKQLKYKK